MQVVASDKKNVVMIAQKMTCKSYVWIFSQSLSKLSYQINWLLRYIDDKLLGFPIYHELSNFQLPLTLSDRCASAGK